MVIEQPAHPRTGVEILAVGRLIETPEPYVAMFDLLIGSEAHFPKLAKILLDRLIRLGRAFRFKFWPASFGTSIKTPSPLPKPRLCGAALNRGKPRSSFA